MLESILIWLLLIWLVWIGGNLFLFILGLFFASYESPTFDGFRVHIPKEIASQATEAELAAVINHELGHKAHLHVWENLARVFFFIPASARRRAQQEIEADDFVKDPLALASFLRKTSRHPFDKIRATRLEWRAFELSVTCGRPTTGMVEQSTYRGSK